MLYADTFFISIHRPALSVDSEKIAETGAVGLRAGHHGSAVCLPGHGHHGVRLLLLRALRGAHQHGLRPRLVRQGLVRYNSNFLRPPPGRTRLARQAHDTWHPHKFSSKLPLRSIDRACRAFPFGVLREWNSLPEEFFQKGFELSLLQDFKCSVNRQLHAPTRTPFDRTTVN